MSTPVPPEVSRLLAEADQTGLSQADLYRLYAKKSDSKEEEAVVEDHLPVVPGIPQALLSVLPKMPTLPGLDDRISGTAAKFVEEEKHPHKIRVPSLEPVNLFPRSKVSGEDSPIPEWMNKINAVAREYVEQKEKRDPYNAPWESPDYPVEQLSKREQELLKIVDDKITASHERFYALIERQTVAMEKIANLVINHTTLNS